MDFHQGSGTIVYDPYRGAMKKRTNGWCVVEVDKEITRYLRWWMRYEKHIYLQPPSWDAHISIVRGERLDPSVQQLWKKYHRQGVNFVYEHINNYRTARSGFGESADNGVYYWVDVECPLMDSIRRELGLRQGWKFHLTFGRTYEYEARKPKR
jgi:hypothetical protein